MTLRGSRSRWTWHLGLGLGEGALEVEEVRLEVRSTVPPPCDSWSSMEFQVVEAETVAGGGTERPKELCLSGGEGERAELPSSVWVTLSQLRAGGKLSSHWTLKSGVLIPGPT